MRVIFLLIFFLFQTLAFAGSKAVINFTPEKTKVDKKVEVEFENSSNLFTLKVNGQTVRTFHEMKVDDLTKLLNEEYVIDEYHEETKKVLKTVQLLDAVSDPSDERLIKASMLMLEDSLAVVDNPPGANGDCEQYDYFANRGPGISGQITPPKDENGNDPILDLKMAEQGFFRMGRLTGMTLDLDTSNDNIGHGLYRALGGERSDAIEGDDRGSTFGADARAEFEFEKGSFDLDISNKGYGRLAPQSRTFTFGGVEYESITRYYTDENGDYYQEFLNVQNIELQVKRFVGESDTYVKVTPGLTIRDDQSGLSKSLQDRWHAMSEDYIQYNYVDHMKREEALNLRMEIGKDFVLSENDRNRTSIDWTSLYRRRRRSLFNRECDSKVRAFWR